MSVRCGYCGRRIWFRIKWRQFAVSSVATHPQCFAAFLGRFILTRWNDEAGR